MFSTCFLLSIWYLWSCIYLSMKFVIIWESGILSFYISVSGWLLTSLTFLSRSISLLKIASAGILDGETFRAETGESIDSSVLYK